ncbi:jg25378 [Pararge aegeria aegeria]|uniref:Jg25378 protein n=1 Tax=Pararge aegeria aegeria TaxID=348720 RepID=A0A8S4QB51_9NEOP|nr:jg25378 [Pararge aegeria aegeria]
MPGAFSEIIDDIEDLISSQDITPKERYASRKTVSVRSKKKEIKDLEPVEKVFLESVVPDHNRALFPQQEGVKAIVHQVGPVKIGGLNTPLRTIW